MNTVYIGYDHREYLAYQVAEKTCLDCTNDIEIVSLDSMTLYHRKLLWRPVEDHFDTKFYDHLSDAYQATEFAISRFLIPHIHKKGWALFVDCDVIFLEDVNELFKLADPKYAVMCVKHDYQMTDGLKMDGQINKGYRRKNWSSVMLINCDHIAHTRMPVAMINQWPGILLHQFAWLKDDEIGEIPCEWNWLVNVTEKPEQPKIAHYTLGGPWFKDWKPQPYDDIWLNAKEGLENEL